MKYYLAIDIGASSGRHILGHLEGGRLVCEEVYRFRNGNELLLPDGRYAGPADGQEVPPGSHRIWNTEYLFHEIVEGMKRCGELGKIPATAAIDTWGVDYVLLDAQDRLAAPCYSYRDSRTEGMDREVYRAIPESGLYQRTGIQKVSFNTIFQLEAARLREPETLEKAGTFLMVPDYFHFLLTGVKRQEYTNATTTQLVSPEAGQWDRELIEALGFPARLFGELSLPGTPVGDLRPEIREKVGYDCRIVLPATHDTASAVMSVPSEEEEPLYLSSGTWSLLGCERREPDCSPAAQAANFTNEGGYGGTYRFLKNIMGLWMIQSAQKEFQASDPAGDYSFSTLCDRASRESIPSLVDAESDRFLAPQSMVREIRAACRESGQPLPGTPWEISCVIYRSLAECYRKEVRQLEAVTGKQYGTLHVVGGGSHARWLNELTARATGKTVLAGPAEATALGCLGAQMIADGAFSGLRDFRRCVRESSDVAEYAPR